MSIIFGGVTITSVQTMPITQLPHRKKQTVGKRVTIHDIIDADTNDNIIDIRGTLTADTQAALQALRNSLEDLNDGAKHAYADASDSRYDGDYTIETGTLAWERLITTLAIRFSMRIVQW